MREEARLGGRVVLSNTNQARAAEPTDSAEAPRPVKTWRPSATALRATMVSPSGPRFQPLNGRSLQDDEEAPAEVDDRYLLSPCVTSPLLDDGMEVIAGKDSCVHRWPCWLASAAVVGLTLWTLKAHIGVAIMWLATLAEHAGPWGIVATVLVLAVWVMLLMPISLFEVLVGHVFPLRTAPQQGAHAFRRVAAIERGSGGALVPAPASPNVATAFGPPGARRLHRGQEPGCSWLLRHRAASQASGREAHATPQAAAGPRAHRACAPAQGDAARPLLDAACAHQELRLGQPGRRLPNIPRRHATRGAAAPLRPLAAERGARAFHPTHCGTWPSHPTHRVWQAPMYALPPVLLGSQLNDLADLAAGRQRIRPHPLQLGLGVLMLLLLVLLATTSHRWLEAEQRGAASDLPRGTDDTETEPVLTPTARKDYGNDSPGPPRGV